MKSIVAILLVFLLGGSGLAGCTDAPSKMEQAPVQTDEVTQPVDQAKLVKGVVMRYTHLLAEGYARLNMGGIAQVAGEKQTSKLYFHMAAMGEGGVKMLSNLMKIEFTGVEFSSEAGAEVSTSEHWEYTYYTIVTGEKKYENDASYRLVYTLKKTKDQWLVEDVRIVESREGPGKGELSFLTRPGMRW